MPTTPSPWRRHFLSLITLLAVTPMLPAPLAVGQPAQPATQSVTDPDPTRAIGLLRAELVDAFNKGDMDRLLSHLDPDVVVTWQNAEVCRGPQAVRAFYERMMVGPDRVVRRISASPTVDDRHVYDGSWAVSWGNMHDEFELNDGSGFRFDSRFTATIARRGDAWKVVAFHASVNAFDNAILGIAAKKAGTWAGIGGAVVGLVVGAIIGLILGRRRRAGSPPAAGT
ncbi:MAG TPA: nuclear transport factor 2 family protein [Tepidisphaeraceae bacterium]|nr:nuclear transport factor 2 family protein [Tepidisphaeraceae bacterium]